jgi:hypothetical protein
MCPLHATTIAGLDIAAAAGDENDQLIRGGRCRELIHERWIDVGPK